MFVFEPCCPADTALYIVLLHCALAAVQCIVIGPVCWWVGGFVFWCVCVGGSFTRITQNCVH